MHHFLVNASIQLLPIVQDKHPYEWVDEAILVIQKSGIKYKIGPFATIIEGSYEEVMEVINQINDKLLMLGCEEWLLNFQINMRSQGDMTANEKIAKFMA